MITDKRPKPQPRPDEPGRDVVLWIVAMGLAMVACGALVYFSRQGGW